MRVLRRLAATTCLPLLLTAHASTQNPAPPPPPAKLELIHTFGLEGGPATAAAFAADGSALATAGELGDIILRDLPTRTERWRSQPGDHWVGELAFSPDGTLLACKGRHLTIHDVKDGKEVGRFANTGPNGFAWAPQGRNYAFARGDQVILGGPHLEQVLATLDYPPNTLCYGAAGDLFVGDNVGRLWHVPAGSAAPELITERRLDKQDWRRYMRVEFAGGALFELTSPGGLRRGSTTFAMAGNPYAFAATADGRSFALGGDGKVVRWWTEAGAKVEDLPFPAPIGALAFSPDGQALFVGTDDGKQALHRPGQEPIALPVHPRQIRTVVMSPDGTTIAVVGSGYAHWSVVPSRGGPVRDLPGAKSVVAGRHGSELLVQEASRIQSLDGVTGAQATLIADASTAWSDIAAGPGRRILRGLDSELVDPESGSIVPLPKGLLMHSNLTVARAPDGTWAVGSVAGIEGDFGALVVTDAAGAVRFSSDAGPVYTVSFAVDGSRLYTVSGTGISVGMGPTGQCIRIHDAKTGVLLREVAGRFGGLWVLDAKHALVENAGNHCIFDLAAMKPVQTLDFGVQAGVVGLAEDRQTLVLANAQQVFAYRISMQ